MGVMWLQIDLNELFEPANFLERIKCIGIEQNKCLQEISDVGENENVFNQKRVEKTCVKKK